MDHAEIERRVANFSQWHYAFDLDGVRTPIFDEAHVRRHVERERYFFRPLIDVSGRSLTGKRVLDLGCNAGYWSLKAIEAGADFVYGIDGRNMHIDQANLVFEVKGIDPARYRFVFGNLFDHDYGHQAFDVVLCLGLLYHVAQPVHLFDLIRKINSDLLLIDSTIAAGTQAAFTLQNEPMSDPRASTEFPFVLCPTRQAVIRLVQASGYSMRVLTPRFTDYTGSDDYRLRRRLAFICAKKTDLSAIKGEQVNRLRDFEQVTRYNAGRALRAAQRKLGRHRDHRADTWE